jgi:hypothetical protein
MITLPMPSAVDDDAYLSELCRNAVWSTHQAPWLAACAAYRQHGGDPWAFGPTTFNPDVSDEQYALYDSRRSGARMQRIRQTPGLLSCPMCGSPTTGGLDHYLPRAVYPEFSIMAANLVPACTHCNSGSKGNTYRGVSPERFIHPYFDALARAPLWQVEIDPPYQAATFRAVPLPGLSDDHATLVVFHLKHILGSQFRLMAERLWATFPQLVRNAIIGPGPVTVADVGDEVSKQLRDTLVSTGLNSWHSAFFRGLQANVPSQGFVATRAQLLAPTPLI